MAETAYLYQKFISRAFGGVTEAEAALAIDWLTDDIRVALTTNSYTPNQDTHDFFSDVTNEISASGYAAGGELLASKTLTDTNNVTKFDAANVTWPASTISAARRAVVYKDSGDPATSPLVGWVDFGVDMASAAGTFQITWNSGGIFTITTADAIGFP